VTGSGGDPASSPPRARVVQSRRVYDGRVIAVRLDEVLYPSGRQIVFEIVEHRGAVAMVPLTSDDHVLLVRQFRRPVGAELLEIPAGTIEVGETPEACARRELAEEVGQEARLWERLTSFYPSPGVLTEELHVFLARDLRPVASSREEEDLRVEPVLLRDARRLIEGGEIRDAKSVIGLLLALERLRS
jgi:ADP-ribose pyrophosphatase